jgi:hypothetical protein
MGGPLRLQMVEANLDRGPLARILMEDVPRDKAMKA